MVRAAFTKLAIADRPQLVYFHSLNYDGAFIPRHQGGLHRHRARHPAGPGGPEHRPIHDSTNDGEADPQPSHTLGRTPAPWALLCPAAAGLGSERRPALPQAPRPPEMPRRYALGRPGTRRRLPKNPNHCKSESLPENKMTPALPVCRTEVSCGRLEGLSSSPSAEGRARACAACPGRCLLRLAPVGEHNRDLAASPPLAEREPDSELVQAHHIAERGSNGSSDAEEPREDPGRPRGVLQRRRRNGGIRHGRCFLFPDTRSTRGRIRINSESIRQIV